MPLSRAQKRIWLLDQMVEAPVYNVFFGIRMRGHLDQEALHAALTHVIERHRTQATSYTLRDGEVRQRLGGAPVDVVMRDLRQLSPAAREAKLDALGREEARRPFDLERGAVRLHLATLAEDDHALLIAQHHLVTDGMTVPLMVDELVTAYAAALGEADATLPPLLGDYGDYVAWESETLIEENLAPLREAVVKSLHGVPRHELPADRPRPSVPTGRGRRVSLHFEPAMTHQIRAVGRQVGCSVFKTLFAVFAITMARVSQQRDFALGTFIGGRHDERFAPLLGLFVNAVPVRCDLSAGGSFLDIAAHLRGAIDHAVANGLLPFDDVVNASGQRRTDGENPIYRAGFVKIPWPNVKRELPNAKWETFHFTADEGGEEISKLDLLMHLQDAGGRLYLELEYATDIFDHATAESIAFRFKRMVETVVLAPDAPPLDLPLTTGAAREELLERFNDTAEDYALDGGLHQLFEARAAAAPQVTALCCEGRTLSFEQLNVRANQLARALRDRGVDRGDRVGVCVERSFDLVVAALAVLKAGAAYVPVDPDYPAERRELLITDANLAIVLTSGTTQDMCDTEAARCLRIHEDLLAAYAGDNLDRSVSGADIAYVIYTSGSTGRPKGAANRHSAIRNRLFWMQDRFGLKSDDRVLQKTPFSFDVSVWELFWPLSTGATMVLARPHGHREPDYLADLMEQESVTTVHFVPSMLDVFLRTTHAPCASLRRVILSGEALSHRLQERFFAHPCGAAELYNLYGPTEAAVDVTVWRCRDDRDRDPVPIGKPAANCRIYILNESDEPVPLGMTGHLTIGGVQVGAGYLNRAELTARAFVDDPFVTGGRMYRTGDLARWRADGTIEYCGRIDHQVKVGGCRIELGEIESALCEVGDVSAAVAIAVRDVRRGDRLVAFVVPTAGARASVQELRSSLQAKLPAYMVPARILSLAELPKTANGKLDRAQLAEMAEQRSDDVSSDAPAVPVAVPTGERTRITTIIANIWSDALGCEVTRFDDSFMELGATSLLLIRVHALLHEAGVGTISVADLFNYPTVNALAAHLAPTVTDVHALPLQEMATAQSEDRIAVIGMGCRFPGGVTDPDSLWELLVDGVDAVTEVPADRWDADALYDADPGALGKSVSRWGGFIDGVDRFDPAFFNMSPREAASLDPQHRLLLEVSFEALEDAGRYDRVRGSNTGIYLGICSFDNQARLVTARPLEGLGPYAGTGNVDSMASGRLAYSLGTHGPAISIDTACSSSMVALHLACQALRAGECEMALAAGVNILLRPTWTVYLSRVGMMSPTGRCRAFGAEADGYVRAEGCGVLVLKPLSAALQDGDRVLATIAGTALNQDGRGATLTTPNGIAQKRVIRQALASAGAQPHEIAYVEAHGTGTPLGDPIEADSLAESYGDGRETPLLVGSVKSNFGHAEGAAGIAGVLKAVLMLQRGIVPPTLHVEHTNPHIPWSTMPVAVARACVPLPQLGSRQLIGVSSFGFSGTNGHAILERAPEREACDLPASGDAATSPRLTRPLSVLALSGHSSQALVAQAARMHRFVSAHPTANVADLCHSAAVGRGQLPQRAAIVTDGSEQLEPILASLARGERAESVRRSDGACGTPSVAFVFSGQGSQHVGMGRELYASHRHFREALDRSAAMLEPELGVSLTEVMFSDDDRLRHTAFTQPALVAIELALVELLGSWGVMPTVVIGHSVGEIAAAVTAGAIDAEAALKFAAQRGRLMGDITHRGAMFAVRASEAHVRHVIGERTDAIGIAAINGPGQVVISGDADVAEAVASELTAGGKNVVQLQVSHAFHSHHFDTIMDPLTRCAEALFGARCVPDIPLVGNVQGQLLQHIDADDWAVHARQAVRFGDGLATVLASDANIAVEIGPHPVLTPLVRRAWPEGTTLPTLRRGRGDWSTLLESIAELFVRGVNIDWRAFDAPYERRRLTLPAYPFVRTRHWVDDADLDTPRAAPPAQTTSLIGEPHALPGGGFHHVIALGGESDAAAHAYLEDHRLHGDIVVPGAFYLAVGAAIAAQRFGLGRFCLADALFVRPLIVDRTLELHVLLTPSGDNAFALEMASPDGAGGWRQHMTARIEVGAQASPGFVASRALSAGHHHDAAPLYNAIAEQGIDWGSGWRWLREIHSEDDAVMAKIVAPGETRQLDGPLHPTLIDNAFIGGLARLLAAIETQGETPSAVPEIPFSAKALRVFRAAPPQVTCFGKIVHKDTKAGTTESDIELTTPEGELIATIVGFVARKGSADAVRRTANSSRATIAEIGWQPVHIVPQEPDNTVLVIANGDAPYAEQLGRALGTERRATASSWKDHLSGTKRIVWLATPESANLVASLELLAELCDARVALTIVSRASFEHELGAMVRAARVENVDLDVRGVVLPADPTEAEWALARDCALTASDFHVRIRDGLAAVPRLSPGARHASSALRISLARAPGRVLITGGTGALGMAVATRFVDEGATDLVLLSRRPPSATVQAALDVLSARANVEVMQADVTDMAMMRDTLAHITAAGPLTAVIHAAGIIEDATLRQLTAAAAGAVVAPKVHGAEILHELTRDDDLQAFVVFSSLSSWIPAPGQAAYAVANAAMDALVARRHAAGLPALSVAWGPWGEIGMAAAASDGAHRWLERRGLIPTPPREALDALCSLWSQSGHVAVFTAAARAQDPPDVLREFVGHEAADSDGDGSGVDRQALAALSRTERLSELVARVAKIVMRALGLRDVGEVSVSRALQEQGLDSLLALETRDAVGKIVGEPLPATLVFDYPTVEAIAGYLHDEVLGLQDVDASPAAAAIQPISSDESIAIIGMGLRFPGDASSPDSLWKLLDRGGDAVARIGSDRWDVDALYNPDADVPGTMMTDSAAFLTDIEQFDAGFFGISPREARSLDPQQRLLLECTWEALENAGVVPADLDGSDTGVFVAIMNHDYYAMNSFALDELDGYLVTGNGASVASGRLSYWLGLRGPSMTVNTACSSSLVGIHLACQSLLRAECSLALVGGATVMLTPLIHVEFSRLRALAPDGRCKAFSANADGVGWGEGSAVLALKRLSDAQRDGDPIVATIASSAVNQDGKSNGLTAPNGPAQQAVIRQALARAGLRAGDIDYVEAHGTGTPLGDPIEATALGKVLGAEHDPARPLWVGSIKSNIGHTQAAAGVAGIVKVALAMEHERIPASLHASTPSPHVAWTENNIRVTSRPVPWPRAAEPRRAGVSSFGISGTNAHVIVQEPPACCDRARTPRSSPLLLPVSARDDTALEQATERLAKFLREHPHTELSDVARTLTLGRTHFSVRAVFEATNIAELIEALEGAPPASAAGPLAQRYLAGETVDWDAQLAHQQARIIALPNYPFQRRRHWRSPASDMLIGKLPGGSVDEIAAMDEAALSSLLHDSELNSEQRAAAPQILRAVRDAVSRGATTAPPIYTTVFREVTLPEPKDAPARWLLIEDARGVAELLSERLTNQGHTVSRIAADAPARAWQQALGTATGLCVVCCTALDLCERADADGFESWCDTMSDLAQIGRILGEAEVSPLVWWLTRDAADVQAKPEGTLSAGHAAAWGMLRAWSAEHPALWGGMLDLPSETDKTIIDAIADVVTLGQLGEETLAWRDGWWAERLVQANPRGNYRPAAGTWIVTGGLGAIGATLARWLLANGAKRVVVVSRRGDDAARAPELAAIAHLRIAKADVSDSRAMRELARCTPDLVGIVHAAGVSSVVSVADTGRDELARVTRCKALGAETLVAIAHERSIDSERPLEVVLLSSVAALWGSPSQGAYATANAYLDGLARREQRSAANMSCHVRVRSVAFGPWAIDGMGSRDQRARLRRRGIGSLDEQDGIAGWRGALASNLPHVAVGRLDIGKIRDLFEVHRARPFFDLIAPRAPAPQTADAGGQRSHLRELAAGARSQALQQWLAERASGILGFDRPDELPRKTGFFELGMDSMMAVALRDDITQALGLQLASTVVFNHPDIAALANYLLQRLELPTSAPTRTSRDEPKERHPPEHTKTLSEKALASLVDEKLEELNKLLE